MRLIDTHAHLDAPQFEEDWPDVLERAAAAGVERIICVGTDLASSEKCVELVGEHPGLIYAAAGIHPNDLGRAGPDDMARIARLAGRPEVVAVGETGLDFHHDSTAPDVQMDGFRNHIALARAVGKPLIIHARKSDDEVLQILAEAGGGVPGVRHCFDRPPEVAERYLDLGLYIAVGGAVTRPGYKKLRAAVRLIPADRLLLETDCPYQAPASRVGMRNEPAFVVEILKAVADLRGETLEDVAAVTTANARSLFPGT